MSSMTIVVKGVTRKRKPILRSAEFLKDVKRINRDVGKKMKADFESTTKTWNHKPAFETVTEESPHIATLVGTDDAIYSYISLGTRVRYAQMSGDFSPKTRPNVLGSFPGRGRMLFIDRDNPRPGIKARNFHKLVKRKHEKKYKARIEDAYQKAVKKSTGG